MLPGFRFLFAATFLSMSILVFGLGAAALLRAAHERFASNSSWHAAPEATFVQQVEAARPVLAMLRVEPPAEQTATSAPAAPAPAEPISAAALKQDAPAPPAAAKPDMPAPEIPVPVQVTAAPSDAPMADATTVAAPTPLSEAQVASTAQAGTESVAQTTNEAIPAATEIDAAASSQAGKPATPEADIASTIIATLDNPSITVEPVPPVKTVGTKLDQAAIKKRLRARRAAHRRRMAARAARQALLAALQQQNPFVQSFPQPAAAAAATRGH